MCGNSCTTSAFSKMILLCDRSYCKHGSTGRYQQQGRGEGRRGLDSGATSLSVYMITMKKPEKVIIKPEEIILNKCLQPLALPVASCHDHQIR